MAAPSPTEVTRLLVEWGNGDQAALGELIPLVYDDLRRLAGRYMRRENQGHTLQTSASSMRPTCASWSSGTCGGRTAPTSSPSPRS